MKAFPVSSVCFLSRAVVLYFPCKIDCLLNTFFASVCVSQTSFCCHIWVLHNAWGNANAACVSLDPWLLFALSPPECDLISCSCFSHSYMVTSGMDKKLKVFDIRAFKPIQSYFIPAGASCLSLSHRGLLSAATGDIVQVTITLCTCRDLNAFLRVRWGSASAPAVRGDGAAGWHVHVWKLFLQVYKDVWSTPVSKPYMAHRVHGSVWGLHFCPFEDVLGVGHGDGFTSMLVPGPVHTTNRPQSFGLLILSARVFTAAFLG